MFFACGIWRLADVSSVSPSSALTKDLTLETSAKNHIRQAKNIPYQPLLIKSIFGILTHAEKQFFSKLVFHGPLKQHLVGYIVLLFSNFLA